MIDIQTTETQLFGRPILCPFLNGECSCVGPQKLSHFALSRLNQLDLRKINDRVYAQQIDGGHGTGRSQYCGTISEWILQQASSTDSLDIWKLAVMHYRSVAEYVQHC